MDDYGLYINCSKTLIMTDIKDMAEVKEIRGIQITDSMTYLGVKIYCDRQKTCNSIKE